MAFALSGEDFAGFCTILKGSVGKQCLVVEQKAPCQESLLTSDLGFIGGISEILVLGSRTCRDENTSAKNRANGFTHIPQEIKNGKCLA